MGHVYLVDDLLLRQPTALKVLAADTPIAAERLELFHREAAIAHAIHHPNVAQTYDIGEHEGLPYLTMEWLDGETLRDRVKRLGRLPAQEVWEIATALCRGLRAAHGAGIVHRDLKPANVMLVQDERRAVLMDFGISHAIESASTEPAAAKQAEAKADRDDAGESSSEPVWGTPAFMAPEQWDGGAVDARTDLYALGCILFYALAGKPPYEARSPLQLAYAHAAGEIPSVVTEVGGGRGELRLLDRLIRRCLAKDPAARPQSADEVLDLLRRPGRRRRYALSLLAVALSCLAAEAAIYFTVFSITRNAVITELRPALERLATLVARDIDVADLDQVHVPADMETDAFRRVYRLINEHREANPGVRYVYTMRRIDHPNEVEFVVDDLAIDIDRDGDGKISKEEVGSPPGSRYDISRYPAMREVLEKGHATSDEDFQIQSWGTLISGYAPVLRDGKPDEYFVGVDVDHKRLTRLRHGLTAILAAVVVTLVVGYAILAYPLRGGSLGRRLLGGET